MSDGMPHSVDIKHYVVVRDRLECAFELLQSLKMRLLNRLVNGDDDYGSPTPPLRHRQEKCYETTVHHLGRDTGVDSWRSAGRRRQAVRCVFDEMNRASGGRQANGLNLWPNGVEAAER